MKRVPTRWKDKKLHYPSSDYPQSSNTDLPKHFSVIAVIGARGAGKTALITQLLSQYAGTVRDPKTGVILKPRYVVCSPTIVANESYFSSLGPHEAYSSMDDGDIEQLVRSIEDDKAEWEDYEELSRAYQQLMRAADPERVLARLPEHVQAELIENDFNPPQRPSKDRYVTYLICDDVVGTELLAGRRKSAFKNLLIKNRHHQAVIIMCLQALKELPRSMRMNVSCWALGKYGNPKVITDFHEECCGDLQFRRFKQMYDTVHQRDHAFLCIDHSQPKDKRFTDSFRERLLLE
jgi:hypothetical protein